MSEHAVIAAPFGRLGLKAEAGKLVAIDFLSADAALAEPVPGGVCAQAAAELAAWFAEPATPFRVPYELHGSPFQLQVWQGIAAIPLGQTLSYGELAEKVGGVARAVGGACGRNPLPIIIPCHRVLAQHGLGGFNRHADGEMLSIKQWLLAHERQYGGNYDLFETALA
jgi:methylated-DNA-[protein]-cysteine S-methyltransferase